MVALCLEIIEKFSGRSLLFGNALPEKTRYCTENSDKMWKKLRAWQEGRRFSRHTGSTGYKSCNFHFESVS
jgi:hypothetical protein